MTWTTIRLELARTPAFPNGSAARSYVLRLPLANDGRIDEREYGSHPELATVRRFWPNQPDRHGRLLRTKGGWALAYDSVAEEGGEMLRLGGKAISTGSHVMLNSPNGDRLPFEVKALAPASRKAALPASQ